MTGALTGGTTISNSGVHTSGSFSTAGAITTGAATSNQVGGVTLNTAAISGVSSIGMTGALSGGTTISNSGSTTSGSFSTAGAITTGAATSNQVGGVTLSNSRLGVNCNAPAYSLDVTGQFRNIFTGSASTAAYTFGSNNDTYVLQTPTAKYGGGVASLMFGLSAATDYPLARIYGIDTAASGTYLGGLGLQVGYNIGMVDVMRLITVSGAPRVGINCNAPSYTLDVSGNAAASTSIIGGSGYLGNLGANSATTFAILGFNSSNQAGIYGRKGTNNNYAGLDFVSYINTVSTTVMTISPNSATVGINCNAPAYTLDVTVPLNGIGTRFQNTSAHGMCTFSAQGALSSGSYTFSNAAISNIALLIGGFHLENTAYWADFVTYFSGTHVYNNLSYTSSAGFNLTSSGPNQLIFTFSGLGSTNYSFSATIYYTLY
jgi:hypothetical protein